MHVTFQISVSIFFIYISRNKCFPGGSDGKESACNAGDLGSIPVSGRSPGKGKGHPLHYSCLGNPMDRGAWWATVCGVTRSQAWLSNTHSGVECWVIWQSYFYFFEKPPVCFPQWLHQFTFPTTVYESSLSSISLPTFIICVLFDNRFWQVWGAISLWFWFAFPWWLAMLNIFSWACWPSAFLLWKSGYSILLLSF